MDHRAKPARRIAARGGNKRKLPTTGCGKQPDAAVAIVEAWFAARGRVPFPFQRQAWEAVAAGRSGLIHAPTGHGKTLAMLLGPIIKQLRLSGEQRDRSAAAIEDLRQGGGKLLEDETSRCERSATLPPADAEIAQRERRLSRLDRQRRSAAERRRRAPRADRRLRVLWITPLRSLATDLENSMRGVLQEFGFVWEVEKRTGDTEAAVRRGQQTALPEILITTPESLSVMLSWSDAPERLVSLGLIVVDEWHELLGTKRGVQTELALARLRRWQPAATVWGLSATIGNLEQARDVLLGAEAASAGEMISPESGRPLSMKVVIPPEIERFPWAGHLGLRLLDRVVPLIEGAASTLLFTNTRSQSELWYQAILGARPDWTGQIAVHHGSIDRQMRLWIEESLRGGRLRCCVCTSSLDLGVDFAKVDQVIQIGSPKGIARLLQRAGRSNHRPGESSRIVLVPTHVFELIEYAALRRAIAAEAIERREPLHSPLDVLVQHLVTIGAGGGFEARDMFAEVRSTWSYRNLPWEEFCWALDFVERGGAALGAYPDFQRLRCQDGRYQVVEPRIARLHRLSIGTITSDAAVTVKFLNGRTLGHVEESFIDRIEPGDQFAFAGTVLRLERYRDNTAWVRKGRGEPNTVPRWMGGRMPLSTELAAAVRATLAAIRRGEDTDATELQALQPLLDVQRAWSLIPAEDELLIERWADRHGHYLFIYPFDGRLVHEGLATLFAWRLSQRQPISFSMAVSDYGLLLVSPTPCDLESALVSGLLSSDGIERDCLRSLNAGEMGKRQFREVARIAGLIFQGYPGQKKTGRHLQASSNLFYDVFREYDPDNLLLRQAEREVLEIQLEHERLRRALDRLRASRVVIRDIPRPTPMAFPLIVENIRDRLSSESLADRVRRMQQQLEAAAPPRSID